ncbi:DNA primase [Hydrogenophaga sp. OTU3427]|uniref:DNA primase n=1 Tax=Hydrogenophaga sp. OTU3427 TaxID=3043856 RepID=UPI00313E123D
MAIPQSFIQELLSRIDVVEIVGRHVQLKKGGANFMGLCPFHGEKSPSFSVSPSKQFYHCFGCGVSGDAIKFLTEHTGVSFIEAVKDLAGQVGLQVPEEELSPQERARAAEAREKQVTLTDVLEKAAHAYAKHLKGAPRAVDYLKKRGLTGQIAKTFGLGYAPEGWRFLSTVFPDYTDARLEESGLVIVHRNEDGSEGEDTKRYDRFRDRIMFPIRNVKGEVIAFGGRVLDQGEPKYLNSPETPVFSKGRELYGLFEARTAMRQLGYALVTEGYMDVVALAQLGFGNAVATLGTACTAEHVHKLFRFTESVVFSFDGDGAGRRAARKALDAALPLATDTRSVKFLFLPAEHDPDSFIRENGADAFAAAVKGALPLSRFLLDAASADCDLDSAEGRARMASQARPLWSAMPDGALKRQLLGDIADMVQLGQHELNDLWQLPGTGAPRKGGGGKRQEREPHQDGGYAEAQETGGYSGGHGAPYGGGYGSGGKTRRDGKPWGNYRDKGSERPRRLPGGRSRPASRGDRAVGLLLANAQAWDSLSAEDQAMLAHLPEPHGPLLAWLEAQLHEHGAQPWAALREGLRGHAFEAFALQQVEQATAGNDAEAELIELRDVMDRLRLDQWENEASELAPLAADDPAALQRLRELSARIRAHKSPKTGTPV